MEFRILGPLEIIDGGNRLSIPSPQQRAILCLLIVNANHVLATDRIVDEIWANHLPESGVKALGFHISRLRDALSPGRGRGAPTAIDTEAGGYVLRVAPDAVDALRFEKLAHDGHEQLRIDPHLARTTLEDALALWRGDPLADVTYLDFAQRERARLEELWLTATGDRIEADLASGRHQAVLPELEALIETSPLNERVRGLLMLALYRSGRQAEALRVHNDGRRLLSAELGIDPSPELVRLESQILAQDPALDAPATAAGGTGGQARGRNPYKGLRAFAEGDSPDFFGREELVGRLMERLDDVAHGAHLLAVVGPSGSGKSSVVRAGLVPAVRVRNAGDPKGGQWRIATMVPGTAPFQELASALRATGRRVRAADLRAAEEAGDLRPLLGNALTADDSGLLLVIDQFEELFLRVAEAPRRRFADALASALSASNATTVVLVTLRADCLHLPLALPALGTLIGTGIELVTPMTRAELERAIERPAEHVGVHVEPALVAQMTADIEARPGALPLLQFALTELFERSDGTRITRAAYDAIGGVSGALGRRADEAWRSFDAGVREACRQVLLRLVQVGEGDVVVARRVARTEIEALESSANDVEVVLNELGHRRLLTFDIDSVTGAPTVEIAHEALLAHWPRLAGWIDDLRDDLANRRRLADAAQEWQAAGRAQDFLLRGAKLDRFDTWQRNTRLKLTDAERGFLAASMAERTRLASLEAERARRERGLAGGARVARRALVGVVVFGLVLAGVLSAALVGQQQNAVEQNEISAARELAGASIASLGTNRQLSVLLALHAADATARRGYVTDDAYDALQWALQEAQVAYPAAETPVGVRAAPDGPRGVFLVAPDELMRLGIRFVHRTLTSDECRTYRRSGSCAAVEPPAEGVTLGLRTSDGRVAGADSTAVQALPGTRVRVLSELPYDISPLTSDFAAGSGIEIDWDPATDGDLDALLAARQLPDVAIVSRPAQIAAAAKDGWLIEIGGRVAEVSVVGDASGHVSRLDFVSGSSGDARGQYGLPLFATIDDLLWYRTDSFAAAGYVPPATRDELDQLVEQMTADGRVPWCLGYEAGSWTGSSVASWVENLVLGADGTSVYDKWTAGQIPFGSSTVNAALGELGSYLGESGAVFNGLGSAAHTRDRVAGAPMALSPPGCWLLRGSSLDRAFFPSSMAAQLAAVPYPAQPDASTAVLGRVYSVVMLRDRPEVRRFIDALTGTDFTSPVASSLVSSGIFPLLASPQMADPLAAAQRTRLDAAVGLGLFRVHVADVVPGPVALAFCGDVSWYLSTAGGGSDVMSSAELWEWAADQIWDGLRKNAWQ